MRALILLVCLSLRIFVQEIRSLEQHLEVVSFNAVTVFFIKVEQQNQEKQDFHKYFLYIVK